MLNRLTLKQEQQTRITKKEDSKMEKKRRKKNGNGQKEKIDL
jgi:hypothetical protein